MVRWRDPRRFDGGVAALRYRRALVRTAVGAAVAGWPIVPGAWWSGADRRFVCDQLACARTGPHPAVSALSVNGSFDASGGDSPCFDARDLAESEPAFGEHSLDGHGLNGPSLDARDLDVHGLAAAGVGGPGLGEQALRHPEAVIRRWRRRPYTVLVPTGETCDVVDVPAEVGRRLATRLDARSSLGPVIAAGPRWLLLTAPGPTLREPLDDDVLVHGKGSWIMLPPSLGPGGEPAMWLARPRGSGWALPSRDVVLRLIERSDLASSRRGDVVGSGGLRW